MSFRTPMRSERGIALVVVLLVALAVAAISVGAGMLSTSTSSINLYSDRLSVLEAVAEAGLEEARSAINGDRSLYPDSLYVTLEDRATVRDIDGAEIPNVRRSTYVGPTGVTTGQYGVFGSIVTVVEDDFGNRIVRRQEVFQESFAKYAYFTNSEGGNIYFGGGDQIFGPLHTNDRMRIHSSGATFHSTVETAQDIYQPEYGDFRQGYTEYGRYIPMPETADLLKLQVQASTGNTAFVGNSAGTEGQATTRIEFVAVDINGDGDVTDDNEGFIKVYQALNNAPWVTAHLTTPTLQNSPNCGDFLNHNGVFVLSPQHPRDGHNWRDGLADASRRCYPGGHDSLFAGVFTPNDGTGAWLAWPGAVDAAVLAARPADAAYLFPINRQFNPSFRGVIFVEGRVAISGVLRGRVTVAATDDIVIVDDVTYSVDPGAGTCTDILGIFSGDDVIIADNTINAPQRRGGGTPNPYYTFDDTKDEFIHGVILALSNFTVQNYDSGSNSAEPCEATVWGRGCIYLTGGVIQDTRGAVGLTTGYGYLKRYAYDQCAGADPPPYFPTTGHFARGRFFEVNPVGFDVAGYYDLLTPAN
jgi:Tfp pilus assembly protein PilX